MMAPQPPPGGHSKGDYPWWLVALVVIGIVLAAVIVTNDIYAQVFRTVFNGVGVTVFVTLVGFALATALGLGIALLGLSDSVVLRQISRFYIEVIRGVPMLVLLFYVAFVGAPAIVAAYNFLTGPLVRAGLVEPVWYASFR
jgi:polar amino acid transport system permease protein